jgi:hypothetical protein
LNLYTYCYNNPVIYSDPSGHEVQWNQWDNLIGSFIKRGYDITRNNSGINSINDIWQNFNSTMEFIGAIANGEISLDDLKAMGIDSVVGDIKCVANNWNIVSDKKKYSNAVISDFGSHLAGAYEEIVSLGYAVYGLAKFAKGLASMIKGASNLAKIGDDFGKLGKLVKNPGIKADWANTTTHGLERMAERGVTQGMVDSWVQSGKVLQQSSGNYLYITKDGAAVLNNAGKLVTTYSSANFDSAMWEVVKKLFGN